MSIPNTKRDQLIAKLKEMFQMDQADLDFGIYGIGPMVDARTCFVGRLCGQTCSVSERVHG